MKSQSNITLIEINECSKRYIVRIMLASLLSLIAKGLNQKPTYKIAMTHFTVSKKWHMPNEIPVYIGVTWGIAPELRLTR